MWKKLLVLTTITAYITGCSTLGETTFLGAGIGGAAGAGMGLAVEQSAGSALIGMGIGAVLGSAISYAAHKEKEKKEAFLKFGISKKRDQNAKNPLITRPEVRRIWVEEKYLEDGKVYEEGHFKYFIDKQSTFAR